ncbi:DUF4340 domain-containing protein [bacterium]|nr:DUF4340 domain-containing protein [bacterium]
MKDKMLIRLAVVFVVLLGIALITKPRQKGVNIDELVQNVVFGFSTDDVHHIEIYKETEGDPAEVKLSKVDGTWRVLSHFNALGSKSKVDRLLNDVLEMTGKVRTTDPKHLETYKITDTQGLHLILKGEAETAPLANLIIGKRSEDANSGFVRISGKDKVYAVDKNLLSSLSVYGDVDTVSVMKQSIWVELQATDKKADDYAEAALVSGGKTVHLRKVDRTKEETVGDSTVTRQVKEWTLVRGSREIDLDQTEVNNFFRDAGKIRGTEVTDQITNSLMQMDRVSRYGLDRPAHYLVFQKADGTREEVLFGKEYEKDKGYYMETRENGLVYKVAKANFDKIVKWADELPKKTK